MKILESIPKILTPDIKMDSKLNMHFTLPVIDAGDFIMYGRTMLMRETGILNENICNNLLFSMESIYSLCLKEYAYDNFWDNSVKRQAWKIAVKIAGQVWVNSCIFQPILKSGLSIHMSNVIWRRLIKEQGGGNVVSMGVYPDKNVIPAHNFLIGETTDTQMQINQKIEGSLGYLTDEDESHLPIRGYNVYYYYNPLPPVVLNCELNSPDCYGEFYDKCDKRIYKWMERFMSALMLVSSDTVFTARDTAYISLIEGMPDESSFPFGDVLQTNDRTPIKKLSARLEGLDERSFYPNRKIWTAAQCERYLPDEVQQHIRRSLQNIPLIDQNKSPSCTADDINRVVRESITEGHLTGLNEHLVNHTNSEYIEDIPLEITSEQKDISELSESEPIEKQRERNIKIITSQSLWDLSNEKVDDKTMIDVNPIVVGDKNKIQEIHESVLSPGRTEDEELLSVNDINKIKIKNKDILDKAFVLDVKTHIDVNNIKKTNLIEEAKTIVDGTSKEAIERDIQLNKVSETKNALEDVLDKAFTDREDHKISTSDKLEQAFIDIEKTRGVTALPKVNKQPHVATKDVPCFLKLGKNTPGIGNILDLAFIDNEIE